VGVTAKKSPGRVRYRAAISRELRAPSEPSISRGNFPSRKAETQAETEGEFSISERKAGKDKVFMSIYRLL
jgi:hypothetical protein